MPKESTERHASNDRTKTYNKLYMQQYRLKQRIKDAQASRALQVNSVSLALQCKMSANKHKHQHTHIPKSCSCLLPIERNPQLMSDILSVLTPLHT